MQKGFKREPMNDLKGAGVAFSVGTIHSKQRGAKKKKKKKKKKPSGKKRGNRPAKWKGSPWQHSYIFSVTFLAANSEGEVKCR